MKWMLSSTASPIAMQAPRIVNMSSSMPTTTIPASADPIGTRLGTMLTSPARRLPIRITISGVIRTSASA